MWRSFYREGFYVRSNKGFDCLRDFYFYVDIGWFNCQHCSTNDVKELHVSTSQITWVVTIYLIVISAIVLIFGRLGDLIGKSRIARIGWGFYFRLSTGWFKLWLGLSFYFLRELFKLLGLQCLWQLVLELFQKFFQLKVEPEHFQSRRCLFQWVQSLDQHLVV